MFGEGISLIVGTSEYIDFIYLNDEICILKVGVWQWAGLCITTGLTWALLRIYYCCEKKSCQYWNKINYLLTFSSLSFLIIPYLVFLEALSSPLLVLKDSCPACFPNRPCTTASADPGDQWAEQGRTSGAGILEDQVCSRSIRNNPCNCDVVIVGVLTDVWRLEEETSESFLEKEPN